MIKVFNNITAWHLASLARPAGAPDRSALPIAGDDQGRQGGRDKVPRRDRARGVSSSKSWRGARWRLLTAGGPAWPQHAAAPSNAFDVSC